MMQRIGKYELAAMIAGAAEQIRTEQAMLSQLDCAGGDGDHGTTMVQAMQRLEAAMDGTRARELGEMLREAGWAVLGVDGGASSAILGTFIAGMGNSGLGEQGSCRELASSFAAGLRAVEAQTKARPGDKTMMDALVPAVAAFDAAAAAGREIGEAMREAAEAARQGAERTRDMTARYGRARFAGERTRGCQDPGATSIALLFCGFSAAFAQEERP